MKTIILIIGLLSALTAFASEPCTPEIQEKLDNQRSELDVIRAYERAIDGLRRGSMYEQFKGNAVTKAKSHETAVLAIQTLFNSEKPLIMAITMTETKYDCRD